MNDSGFQELLEKQQSQSKTKTTCIELDEGSFFNQVVQQPIQPDDNSLETTQHQQQEESEGPQAPSGCVPVQMDLEL